MTHKAQYEYYEKHIAIDFPFFHKVNFLGPLDQAPADTLLDTKFARPPPRRPRYSAPLLLAFLTQTARFHPDLVKEHGGNAIETARFYADATSASLGSNVFDIPAQETVQTYLMLGYHNWSNHEGDQGFLRVRHAISCAQLLGYQWDADLDKKKPAGKGPASANDGDVAKDLFIHREIQRRTFWSCFCMDRILGGREKRPQILKSSELNRVQLPCSDKAFQTRRKVKTRLLHEDDETYARRREHRQRDLLRSNEHLHNATSDQGIDCGHDSVVVEDVTWEVGEDEAELNVYIHAIDVMGNILTWAIALGRR